LRKNAIPLTTVDYGHGFTDLEAMQGIFDGAAIVGLGEATHGTSEFFRMKHRLLEFLVERQGFRIFAIEANMPEAQAINRYVLTGVGDPKTLLEGIHFWTWNTEEVLDLMEWIRQYNVTHSSDQVQFVGFDMQYADVAVQNVKDGAHRVDPSIGDSVSALLTEALRVEQDKKTLPLPIVQVESAYLTRRLDSFQHSLQNRRSFPRQGRTMDSAEWLLENANITVQALKLELISSPEYRDSCMAANLGWIAKHNPGKKIVAWAHNGHISRIHGAMGNYLSHLFGGGYRNIGFLFYSGAYSAMAGEEPMLRSNIAPPSRDGSVEAIFHQIGIPLFAIDLRAVPYASDSRWLSDPLPFRDIGSKASDVYSDGSISNLYDGVIYIEKSSPSHLLTWKN
jgi:erythromycin esterase